MKLFVIVGYLFVGLFGFNPNNPCTNVDAKCKLMNGEKYCAIRGQSYSLCNKKYKSTTNIFKKTYTTYTSDDLENIEKVKEKRKKCKEKAYENHARSYGRHSELGAFELAANLSICNK